MYPINLFFSKDVEEEEKKVVLRSLGEIPFFLPKGEDFHIKNFGNWFQGNEPFQSFQWYEDQAWIASRQQLNAGSILMNFLTEPWQEQQRHVDFAVVGRNATAKNNGGWLNFIFGLSSADGVGLVSTYRFNYELTRDKDLRDLCLRRAVLHEFFHILGLVPKWRKTNRGESLGAHCTNLCVMRQGLSVSEWARYALEERDHRIILCSQCQENLLAIFKAKG